jgi:hypothetical protein
MESVGIFAPGTHLPEPTALDAHIRPVAAECYPLAGDKDADEEPRSKLKHPRCGSLEA